MTVIKTDYTVKFKHLEKKKQEANKQVKTIITTNDDDRLNLKSAWNYNM